MNFKERKRLSMDLIESIMLSRGIEDIDLYLEPTDENDTDLSKIPNFNEASAMIQRNIGKDIVILVDADADGNTSAAIMYKYVKFINPFAKVRYFLHEKKTHGFTKQFVQYVLETKPDLVIVPDAGTNDIVQREEIVSHGIDLLIIDHHNEDKTTSKGGILINNHAKFPPNEMNKNMTGAGMTYLFCKALDKFVFNTGRIETLKDLAMVGIIGDCASLFENETRNLCVNALNDIQSKMIRTVIEANKQDVDDVTFTNMQWGGIIPLINAVVRIGTLEEKELMFKALADIDVDYFRVVEKRKLNKDTRKYEKIPFKLNIYELAYDAAQACRARQNKIVNTELELAKEKFNEDAGIQIYTVQTDECKALTGLLANKLTDLWQQPVLVILEMGAKYSGSLRGWEKTISNLKKWCESTELFEMVQGHDNAAGVVFESFNYDAIIEKTKHVESEEYYYEVDKIYNEYVDENDISDVSANEELFKNGVTEPQFAVTSLQITPTNTKWSKKTLRIYTNRVTYIKFKVSEEEYLDLIERHAKIDALGTFAVNVWNNNKYPQMMISEYEIVNDSYEECKKEVKKEDAFINFGMFA